jgi:hypothetical protein
MAIGLKVGDEVKVSLGEIKEQLLYDLGQAGVQYTIPFDKTNKNDIKETIIAITDLGIEISVENDIITYIKSDNNEYTHLDTIENIEDTPLEHVKTIKNHVINKFNDEDYSIKFEKIDTKTMNIVVIISSETGKARINILREGQGNVYINTIRAL